MRVRLVYRDDNLLVILRIICRHHVQRFMAPPPQKQSARIGIIVWISCNFISFGKHLVHLGFADAPFKHPAHGM